MIKKFLLTSAAFVFVAGLSPAFAQTEYEISIDITSDGTVDDLDVVAGYLDAAADGTQAGRGVRKTANSLVAEMDLLANDRVDDYGMLTLDDGSQVQLIDGDKIVMKPKHNNGDFHRARIYKCDFSTGQSKTNWRWHSIPSVITVFSGSGFHRILRIPNARVAHDNYPCGNIMHP